MPSATDEVTIALPGPEFRVLALDGNPVAVPRPVPSLPLAPVERVDAIVEMTRPGVWIFGSTDDHERAKGMGMVVEYAERRDKPKWLKPPDSTWDDNFFGSRGTATKPDHTFNLVFEKVLGGRGGFNRWTINGKSFPDTKPLRVEAGKRYRLVLRNNSGDAHPIHLHRHTFELTKVAGKFTSGIIKDVIDVPRYRALAAGSGLLVHGQRRQDGLRDDPQSSFSYRRWGWLLVGGRALHLSR